jgi:acyl-CoA synthetase (AMP-forming)/AMP-acid ligase II
MGFEPQRGLVNLPVNHIGCIGDLCATLLVSAGTLVFMDRFEPQGVVRCLVEQRLSWLGQVPAQFQLLLGKGGLGPQHLRGVRHLLWGGAAMPEALVRRLKDWVPDVMSSYGLTECSGTIAVTTPDATLTALADTVGRPVAADRLRVVDTHDRPLASGSSGEIQIHGDHVFRGYLKLPAATRAAFSGDGWLRTGDVGSLDSDGNLRLLGRTHEMFKSGGYSVYPREIEAVIESLPGVELCAVVSVPDPLWSEVGVAYVQADPARVTAQRLAEQCAGQLARYKLPKRFVVRPALPLLSIGKVDKQRLRGESSVQG